MARALMLLIALALDGIALGAQTASVGPDSAAGVVVGTVVDWRRGHEPAHALVSLEPLSDSGNGERTSTPTDSLGRYFARVPAGTYKMQARAIKDVTSGVARVNVRVRRGDTVRFDLTVPPYGFDPARRAAQLDELARNYARWQQRSPAAYRATVKWECFCFGGTVGDWRLEVGLDSTVVLRRPEHRGGNPPIASVEALFEWLETEIRDPGQQVDVRYDPKLGYPSHIDTDTVTLLSDMWTKVEVRALTALRVSTPKR